MNRPCLASLLVGTALCLLAPVNAGAKPKPASKPCGATIAECEASILKALGEANDFNFVAAGALPPAIAEAFAKGVSTNYQATSCIDAAARDSLTPQQLAAVKRSGKVDLYKPAQADVDVMVQSRTMLIARRSFFETSVDVARKEGPPGGPIIVRTNPVLPEDVSLISEACGYETLGPVK